jgi:hypothetical protein
LSFPTKKDERPVAEQAAIGPVVMFNGWELRMCHNALLGDEFYEFLLRIDEHLAAQTQAGGSALW